MKTRKRIGTFILAGIMLFALCACGGKDTEKPDANGDNSGTAQKVVAQWDFVVINSLTHPSSVLCQEFADRIQEASDGRIQITVRAPGELNYNASDYLVAVGDGSVQMADVGSNCFGVLKAGAMACLPYLATDLEDFDAVMSILEPSLEEELATYGAKYLFYYTWPTQSLWTKNKEITSLSDIKGMKIRTVNNELSALVNQLGGTPVSLAGSEVPTALQTGIVDGVITSAYGLGGAGWYDSLNYGLVADCQIIPDYMCINEEAFNALPADLQQVVLDTAEEFQKYMCESMFNDEDTWRETLKTEYDMTINTVPEEETTQITEDIQAYWDSWVVERGGNCAELLGQIRETLGR